MVLAGCYDLSMTSRDRTKHDAESQAQDAWNQMHDLFLARSREAIKRSRRDGTGLTPDELRWRMDARIEAARNLLTERMRPD